MKKAPHVGTVALSAPKREGDIGGGAENSQGQNDNPTSQARSCMLGFMCNINWDIYRIALTH